MLSESVRDTYIRVLWYAQHSTLFPLVISTQAEMCERTREITDGVRGKGGSGERRSLRTLAYTNTPHHDTCTGGSMPDSSHRFLLYHHQ